MTDTDIKTTTLMPPATLEQLDELARLLEARYGHRHLGRPFAITWAIFGEVRRRQHGDFPPVEPYEPHPDAVRVTLNITAEAAAWLDWLAAYDARVLGLAQPLRPVSLCLAIPRELREFRKSLATRKKIPAPA